MSLFFEDEIRKVKRNMDREGLENLTAQDPRTKRDWYDKSSSRYFRQTYHEKKPRDPRNWFDR